jgi:hypothetical protein
MGQKRLELLTLVRLDIIAFSFAALLIQERATGLWESTAEGSYE